MAALASLGGGRRPWILRLPVFRAREAGLLIGVAEDAGIAPDIASLWSRCRRRGRRGLRRRGLTAVAGCDRYRCNECAPADQKPEPRIPPRVRSSQLHAESPHAHRQLTVFRDLHNMSLCEAPSADVEKSGKVFRKPSRYWRCACFGGGQQGPFQERTRCR
jgi:hypothetical protein